MEKSEIEKLRLELVNERIKIFWIINNYYFVLVSYCKILGGPNEEKKLYCYI